MEPKYSVAKIGGKWYATRRGEIASESFHAKWQAEEAATKMMISDLRFDVGGRYGGNSKA